MTTVGLHCDGFRACVLSLRVDLGYVFTWWQTLRREAQGAVLSPASTIDWVDLIETC
jgi:hypothetical protein